MVASYQKAKRKELDARRRHARLPVIGGRRFDPLDPAVAADPYPWLHEAHRAAPVF